LYGYDAPTFVDQIFGESRAPKAKDWIQESQDILRTIKHNLLMAQNKYKVYEDKHRVEHRFDLGDLVYLCLHPYRHSLLKMKGEEKLKPKFYALQYFEAYKRGDIRVRASIGMQNT
jgi:hypothetical protein